MSRGTPHEAAEPKKLSFDDFVKAAGESERALEGYVTFDSAKPTYVLFGQDPLICPNIPISRDLIESIHLGSTHACFGSNQKMWDAEIVLKAAKEGNEANLVKLALALGNKCACSSSGNPGVGPSAMPIAAMPQSFMGTYGRCLGSSSYCQSIGAGYCAELGPDGRAYCSNCCIAFGVPAYPSGVGAIAPPTMRPATMHAYDILPKGTPAPASGWYVVVTVYSTGLTWFYGPYSYEDAQTAFRELYNPSTQATGVPAYYNAGQKLQ